VKNHTFIAYLEEYRAIRFPLDDDGVVAGPAQGEGDFSSGIGFRVDSRLRRLGEDGVAAGAVKRGVGKRTQREDQMILRRKRVNLGRVLLEQEIGSQPLPPR